MVIVYERRLRKRLKPDENSLIFAQMMSYKRLSHSQRINISGVTGKETRLVVTSPANSSAGSKKIT
jgi:hypothetical protein